AMISIAGLDRATVEKLCLEQAQGEVCQIANSLFSNGFACAGAKSAIERLEQSARDKGALQVKAIKTSGGFHTELMRPAQHTLDDALKGLEPRMKPPICDVYMNVTGKKISAGTSPKDCCVHPAYATGGPRGPSKSGVTPSLFCSFARHFKAIPLVPMMLDLVGAGRSL
ncbi:unnamed protein product, partial [Effrenium voratum]